MTPREIRVESIFLRLKASELFYKVSGTQLQDVCGVSSIRLKARIAHLTSLPSTIAAKYHHFDRIEYTVPLDRSRGFIIMLGHYFHVRA